MHCENSRKCENSNRKTSRERIKRVAVVEQKVVEVRTFVPKIVEVIKVVERLVPVETVVEKIVEVPIKVEKIVEKEVEIMRIVEDVQCCCRSERCYNGRLEELIAQVTDARTRLREVQQDCIEQCEFLRQHVTTLEEENDQLKNHISELQNLKLLQGGCTDRHNDLSMEMSMTDQAAIGNSHCTIKTYDLTTSRNSIGDKQKTRKFPKINLRSHTEQSVQSNNLQQCQLNESQQQKPLAETQQPRAECSLKEFVAGQKCNQSILLLLMIKLTEEVVKSTQRKLFRLYKAESVRIGFDSDDNLEIILNPVKGLDLKLEENLSYVPPQTKSNQTPTEKACVYNLGVIWKELISSHIETSPSSENIHPIIPKIIASMLNEQQKIRPLLIECLHMMKAAITVVSTRQQLSTANATA